MLALTSKLDHVRLPAKLLEDIAVEALLAGGTASFATCLFFIFDLHLQVAYTALKEWPMILECTVAPETGILENCLSFLLRVLGDEFFDRAYLAIISLTKILTIIVKQLCFVLHPIEKPYLLHKLNLSHIVWVELSNLSMDNFFKVRRFKACTIVVRVLLTITTKKAIDKTPSE